MKSLQAKISTFLPLFLSHSAENSVVGPYEYAEKLVLDKSFILQKRGIMIF